MNSRGPWKAPLVIVIIPHHQTIKWTDVDDPYKDIYLDNDIDDENINFVKHSNLLYHDEIVEDPAAAYNDNKIGLKVELPHEGGKH